MDANRTSDVEQDDRDKALAADAGEPKENDSSKTARRRIGELWHGRGFTRLLEVLIAISTMVSARVSYVQWEAMQNSNALTRAGLQESRRSADAAVAAVKESQRQFDLSREDAAADAIENKRRFEANLAESKRQAYAADQRAQETLDVSRHQMTEAFRQLESTDRPWVTVAFPPSATFQFHEAGKVALGLSYTLKNIGRSPAINIELHANVIPLAFDDWLTGPFRWQKMLCKPDASPDSATGFSLAPGEERMWS